MSSAGRRAGTRAQGAGEAADEAPIVKLVNLVLTDAVKRGASDIHMEPYEKEFRVRFRIDAFSIDYESALKLKDAITSRLKIMAKLDISEKRLPQDGRIMLKMQIGARKSSSISASPLCPRSGARRLCSGCSTRKICVST